MFVKVVDHNMEVGTVTTLIPDLEPNNSFIWMHTVDTRRRVDCMHFWCYMTARMTPVGPNDNMNRYYCSFEI